MIADRFSVPCEAGNQFDRRMEGLFNPAFVARADLLTLLDQAAYELDLRLQSAPRHVRYARGYEIKAVQPGDLGRVFNMLAQGGMVDARHMARNDETQRLSLCEHPHSLDVGGMGQLNLAGYLEHLRGEITAFGGTIIEGASYIGHRRSNGGYEIETDRGVFSAHHRPVIATGAAHMARLPGFPFETCTAYTMAVVLGPLAPADAARVASVPMAFSDTNIADDFLWGGLDPAGYLTFGRGDLPDCNEAAREALLADISQQLEAYYPGLLKRYETRVSFGPMMIAANKLPIVGRLPDSYVAGGWGGFGIVPGFAAARAIAAHIVAGDARALSIFETLQAGFAHSRQPQNDPEPEQRLAL
jgi:glycine/D-amino acid oxidase-like deaminating enzyme